MHCTSRESIRVYLHGLSFRAHSFTEAITQTLQLMPCEAEVTMASSLEP